MKLIAGGVLSRTLESHIKFHKMSAASHSLYEKRIFVENRYVSETLIK